MNGSSLRGMTEPMSVAAFAESFRGFLEAVQRESGPSAFHGRLSDHLGCDPRTATVLTDWAKARSRVISPR